MLIRRITLGARILAGIAFGLLLLWFFGRGISFEGLWEHLTNFSWERTLPLFALVVISGIVRAYRWRLLFHGVAPPVKLLFFVENTGIGLNSIAPVRVVAEPIQFGYLALREGYDRGVVLASIIAGRVADLVVTLATIAIGFSLFPPEGDLRQEVLTVAIIGIVIALGLAVGSLFAHRFEPLYRFSLVRTYSNAWRELVAQRTRLVLVIGITSVQWMILGIGGWIIADDLGLTQSLPVIYVVMLGTMTVGFILPGLPSGLGPFEAAAISFLALYGVAPEPALAFGLIIHMGLVIPPVIIAIVTLLAYGPPWSTRNRLQRRHRERRHAVEAAASRTAPPEAPQ